MRRIICMLLALVLCLSLPMAAFATAASPSNYSPSSNPKTGDMAQMELWVPMMIISAIALAVVMFIYFKKFRKVN